MPLRYFLSGASGIRPEVLPDVAALIPHRLLSIHDSFKGNTKVWTAISHDPKCAMEEVMLDSGAFTAFTKGYKQTLEKVIAAYDDATKRLSKKIKHVWFINLDVIPGKPGAKRVANDQEVAEALAESDDNLKVLQKRYGKERVLPVYHQSEPVIRLKEVMRQSGGFISMSFRQDFAEEHRYMDAEKSLWVTKSHGILVHGLATTGYDMLRYAHFDTVDSATWLYVAAMGGVLHINERGQLKVRAVSSRSPRQSTEWDHFRTVPKEEQALLLKRMKEAGVTLEQVENDLSYRILMCAHQMREWLLHHFTPNEKMTPEFGLFDTHRKLVKT